ncbi:MAG: hypothetical protein PHH40_04200 [Candidatus Moranbacteria bacterium]|nr:hypothetical protein [Candidatus Moranbacteria bacterium]MDD3964561.1 hypothetical protein [Candidatus Moranbacteria bacterium]
MNDALFSTIGLWMQTSFLSLGSIIVWPVVFLWGENGAIFAFAFASQGLISPESALIFSFLGSFCADLFWYAVTASTLRPWFQKREEKKRLEKKESLIFIKLIDNHPYIFLVILKFLMGVRLVLTLYILTKKKVPFFTYFILTFLGNILFIIVLFPLGWLLGKGIGDALSLGQSLSSFATLFLCVGIGSQILFRLIRYLIIRFGQKVK